MQSKVTSATLLCALLGVSLQAIATANSTPNAAASIAEWEDWQRFVDRFMQADGRIIDLTFDRKSTSEGQSYGLFFALVANDRPRFDAILKWTSDNLADGELGAKLPGWLWGQHENGNWAIKDRNAASDGDLWIAYSLFEAGRLWQAPHYTELAKKILKLVRDKEVVEVSGVGHLLLPGPIGFVLEGDRYRINPSYLPGFMFRYFAEVDPRGPWQSIWQTHMRLAPQIYSKGVAPDIVIVDKRGVVTQDSERAPSGSYDAIRVYLWAGMSGESSKGLLQRLEPFAELIRDLGSPPEKVNPATGEPTKVDYSPMGYAGAVLPFATALGDKRTVSAQRTRITMNTARAKLGGSTNYYDQALILFGKGWHDGEYRFSDRGEVEPKWRQTGGR